MGWINRFYQARHEKRVVAAIQFLGENKETMFSIANDATKNEVLPSEGVEISIDGCCYRIKESDFSLSCRGVGYHFNDGEPFAHEHGSASEQLFTKNQIYAEICKLVVLKGKDLCIGEHIIHRDIGPGDARKAVESLMRNISGGHE